MRLGLGLEPFFPYVLYFGALLAFLASLVRPRYGLFYLVPLIPLQTIRYRALSLPFGQYMVDFVLLGVALGLLIQAKTLIPRTPITKIVLALMAYSFFSLWWGSLAGGFPLPLSFSDPRMDFWKNYMVLPVIFFLSASALETRRDMQIMLVMMCVGALLLAKNFNNNIGSRDYSSFSYSLRTSGAMGYAGVNGLAALQTQFGMFAATMAVFEKIRWRKLGLWAVAAACLYCVVYALSRGAYAAVLVCWVYIAVVRMKPLLLAALVAFLVFWQSLVPGAVRERVLMTIDESGQVESSAAQRIELWQGARDIIEANPIFGKGLHTYAFLGLDDNLTDTHNLYVKLMFETGIIGLALFLVLLGVAYRMAVRLRKFTDDSFFMAMGLGVSIYLVALAVVNVFGDRWHLLQISGYTWILLAMISKSQQILLDEKAAMPNTSARSGEALPAGLTPEPRPVFVGPAKPADTRRPQSSGRMPQAVLRRIVDQRDR
jgi:O-antigen ligase